MSFKKQLTGWALIFEGPCIMNSPSSTGVFTSSSQLMTQGPTIKQVTWPDWDFNSNNGHTYIHGLYSSRKEAEQHSSYSSASHNIRKVLISIEELEPVSYMKERKK